MQYINRLLAGRPGDRSSSPGKERIFSSPCYPDRLWGPPSLLSYVAIPTSYSGSSRNRVVQLYPQALGSLFVALYDLQVCSTGV
jgi:hypothetical protein